MMTEDLPPHVSTRRRKRRVTSNKENQTEFSKNEEKDPAEKHSSSESRRALTKQTLSEFQTAVKATGGFADYWEEYPVLDKIVVKASIAMGDNPSKEGLILLTGQTSKLFSISRQLVKDATTLKSQRKIMDNLVVSLHILRAIGALLSDDSKRERAIKVLYHFLVVTEKLAKNVKSGAVSKLLRLTIEAYGAMGVLLTHLTTKISKLSVTFEVWQSQQHVIPLTFALPKAPTKRSSKSEVEFSEMAVIAIQSTFSFTKVTLEVANRRHEELAEAFQVWSDGESASTKGYFSSVLRQNSSQLLLEVISAWISSKHGTSPRDSIKRGKQTHKILWDASGNLSDDQRSCDQYLDMRKSAILMLLRCVRDSSENDEERRTVVQAAVAYCWKVAATFISSSRSSDREKYLREFYSAIGRALHDVLPQDSLFLVEFRMYRLLHSASAHSEFLGGSNSELDASPLELFLMLVYEGRCVVRGEMQDNDSTNLVQRVGDAVESFDDQVLASTKEFTLSESKRIFQLLSALQFQREVHKWLQDKRKQSEHTLLAIYSLLKCLAALVHAMITNELTEEPLVPKAWSFAVDCFAQAIAVQQQLHKLSTLHASDSDSLRDVDEMIEKFGVTKGCLHPPVDCVEKLSKTLLYYAKKRISSSPDCYACRLLLGSLNLCGYLQGQGASDKFLLDAQWTLLATTYKIQDMIEESILATAFATLYAIVDVERSITLSWEEALVDILSGIGSTVAFWFANPARSKLLGAWQSIGLVGKLVVLFCDYQPPKPSKSPERKTKVLSSYEGIRILQHHRGSTSFLFTKATNSPFSLPNLLSSVLYGGLASRAPVEPSAWGSMTMAFTEAANRLGASLQILAEDDENRVDSDLRQMTSICLSQFTRLPGSVSESLRVTIQGIFRCTLSFASVSCDPFIRAQLNICSPIGSNNLEFSERTKARLQEARDIIAAAISQMKIVSDDEDDSGLLVTAIMPQLCLLRNSLEKSLSEENTTWSSSFFASQLEKLLGSRTRGTKNNRITSVVQECLIASRSRLHDMFCLSGYWILGADSRPFDFPFDDKGWNSTKAISALIQGTISELPNVTSGYSTTREESMSTLHVAILEPISDVKRDSLISELCDQIQQIDDLLSEDEQSFISLTLLRWTSSSGLLARADAYLLNGAMWNAISDFSRCISECRKIMQTALRFLGLRPDASSFVDLVASRSIVCRARDRQLHCLEKLVEVHSRCGDRVKAHSYLASIIELLGIRGAKSTSTGKTPLDAGCKFPRQNQLRRLWGQIVVRDLTSDEATSYMRSLSQVPGEAQFGYDSKIQDSLNSIIFATPGTDCHGFYPFVIDDPSAVQTLASAGVRGYGETTHSAMFGSVCIRELQRYTTQTQSKNTEAADYSVDDIVKSFTNCPCMPYEILAQAYYSAGFYFLRRAQNYDTIKKLWGRTSPIDNPEDIKAGECCRQKSIALFEKALNLVRQNADELARNTLRCLALATGPKEGNASFLIQASLSKTWRKQAVMSLADGTSSSVHQCFDSFSSDDIANFYNTLRKLAPKTWRFVAGALCPSGEVLWTCICDGEINTTCIFDGNGNECIRSGILEPCCNIISKSQKQLAEVKGDLNEKETRRKWWNERQSLDDDLSELLSRLEDILENQKSLEVVTGKPKRRGLVTRFDSAQECESFSSEDSQEHTFLMLDESLQRFPLEGIPSFKDKAVYRIPCVSFVLHKLLSRPASFSVEKENISYVLDPEGNLTGTKERIQPVLDSLEINPHNGIVGKSPSASFFEEALREKDGLLLYFGHGAGERFFGRKELRAFVESHGPGAATAGVVLMGCSSGRLSPPTSSTKKTGETVSNFYEPDGVVYSYLAAGAPMVVGNLWDVTDQDVDRLSVALLSDFFHEKKTSSIALSLAKSRSSCKLTSLVGCAPVCYGMPISLAGLE